jgi:predicted transcriptional regulator
MQNMADLLGVSRVTYYNWTKGKPVKHTNAVKAKALMRKLAAAVTVHDWPTREAAVATRDERFEMLQNILKLLDEQPVTQ